ncbi:unnamed protein product [Parajaminaea phylloscopi]
MDHHVVSLATPSRPGGLPGTSGSAPKNPSASRLALPADREDKVPLNKGPTDDSPPSDDSISAYINQHTSSPPEAAAHEASLHLRREGGGNATRRHSPTRHSTSKDASRPPSSPSPTPADDQDVAAASGMLSLRASQSQDLPASRREPLPSAWSHRARVAGADGRGDDGGDDDRGIRSSDYLVRGENAGSDDAHGQGAHMRSGALRDTLLFDQSPSSRLPFLDMTRQSFSVARAASSPDAKADRGTTSRRDSMIIGEAPTEDEADASASADISQDMSSSLDTQQDAEDGAGGRAKKRRRRTKKEEADVLVSVYEQTAFPDSVTRQKLADQLGMTTRAVSIWFQNRRQAERKKASRFGPLHSASPIVGPVNAAEEPSPAPHRSVSLTSAHAIASAAKLQRWPSLDVIAAHRTMRKGESPASDDGETGESAGHGKVLPVAGAGASSTAEPTHAPATPSASRTSSCVFDVFEDKENVPPAIAEQKLCRQLRLQNGGGGDDDDDDDAEGTEARQPLRDIRDLVFGREQLPSRTQVDEDDLEHMDTPARSRLPHHSSREVTTNKVRRTSLARTSSLGAMSQPRLSMDQVVSRFIAKRPPLSPRRSSPGRSAGLLRFMSLSTSRRGRASLDGKPSPPRKRPFVKSLSASTTLPANLAKMIRDQEETDLAQGAQQATVAQQHDLLAKMPSSSGASSEEATGPTPSNRIRLLDEDEDEERTLRMAANRRVARAQAEGRDLRDKADALTDLVSRPWARSVSGPVTTVDVASAGPPSLTTGRMAPPSLDMAAGRDRSKPNHLLHRRPLRPSLSAGQLQQRMEGSPASGLPAIAAAPSPHAESPAPAPAKKRTKKRKSAVSAEGPMQSPTAHGQGADENVPPPSSLKMSTFPVHSTPAGSKHARFTGAAAAATPNGLPSFGTPRTGMTGRRSFGRSLSAQSSGPAGAPQYASGLAFAGAEDAPSSPMGRGVSGALYANTPASAQRAWGLPSTNAASSGREMTPRSLAFALGLTHNSSAFAHQTPYGGLPGTSATPFGTSSRYSSQRYLPPSSSRSGAHRDAPTPAVGAHGLMGDRAGPYSPLARGREGAVLAPLSASAPSSSAPASQTPKVAAGGKRKSPEDDSQSGGSASSEGSHGQTQGRGVPLSASRSRLPFAKIHSQPSLPAPPLFSTPSSVMRMQSSQQRPQQPRSRSSNLPSMASLAMADADKENWIDDGDGERRHGRDYGSPGDKPLRMLSANGVVGTQGDDSGYAPPSDEDNDNGDGDGDVGAVSNKTPAKRKGGADGAGVRVHGNGTTTESPTRVQQQRQRQHDAAQVLLGLAGEGR